MKLAWILIIIGAFLSRSALENLVTDITGNRWAIIVGIILVIYGIHRLGKKNFKWGNIFK